MLQNQIVSIVARQNSRFDLAADNRIIIGAVRRQLDIIPLRHDLVSSENGIAYQRTGFAFGEKNLFRSNPV